MKTTIQQAIEAKLVLAIITECPYREGTNRYKRYQAYRNGKSVEAVLADKRVRRAGFRWDINTGVIKLVRKSATKH